MKVCKVCLSEKEESEFYKQKNYRGGLDPKCKSCRDECSIQYRKDNIEKIRLYQKEWNKKKSVEERRAYEKLYYDRNREKILKRKREDYARAKDI